MTVDRPQRRSALLVGGSAPGERFVGAQHRWPETLCVKAPSGGWEHHEHRGDGEYLFAGTCEQFDCWNPDWCDVSWFGGDIHSGEHRCKLIGDHQSHVCCCSEKYEESPAVDV